LDQTFPLFQTSYEPCKTPNVPKPSKFNLSFINLENNWWWKDKVPCSYCLLFLPLLFLFFLFLSFTFIYCSTTHYYSFTTWTTTSLHAWDRQWQQQQQMRSALHPLVLIATMQQLLLSFDNKQIKTKSVNHPIWPPSFTYYRWSMANWAWSLASNGNSGGFLVVVISVLRYLRNTKNARRKR
jgi:hypothetical protein